MESSFFVNSIPLLGPKTLSSRSLALPMTGCFRDGSIPCWGAVTGSCESKPCGFGVRPILVSQVDFGTSRTIMHMYNFALRRISTQVAILKHDWFDQAVTLDDQVYVLSTFTQHGQQENHQYHRDCAQ